MFDHKNQNCAFAEQTISFLYDELEIENRRAFDAHLQTCRACADELNGFGAVRAFVADWRALEFDSLAAPKIEINFETNIRPQKSAPAATEKQSWLDGLRKIFSLSPAFAYAAALILTAVCVGLIAYNFGSRQQIATVENEGKAARANASTAQENTNRAIASANDFNENEKQLADEKPLESNLVKDKYDSPQNVKERRSIKISNAARVAKSETIAQKINRAPANRKASYSNAAVAQNDLRTNERRAAPKLSGIEDDDEDSTLRLSDLLGDAGGK